MPDHAEFQRLRQDLASKCASMASNDALPATAQMAADDVARAPDLLSAMKAAGNLLVLIEDTEKSAKEAADTVRSLLLNTMQECGAPKIQTEHHTIAWANGQQSVVITGKLPEKFMRTPDPVPDKAEIKAALKEGLTVEGAHLSNGPPYLSIRARKA